jgi:hypothetical protein
MYHDLYTDENKIKLKDAKTKEFKAEMQEKNIHLVLSRD